MDRKTTFVLALVYLAVILVLGLLFFYKRDLLWFVPDAFGPVPVGVPWFGALGAVVISLTGVFQHEHDWDASYWPWHVARPLVGVSLAVVSVLIVQAGVLGVGATPIQPEAQPTSSQSAPAPQTQPTPGQPAPTPPAQPTPGQPGTTPPAQSTLPKVPTNLLYYLIAFLVGYREETFRELIKRLVDLILTPGNGTGPVPTVHGVDPAQAPHGTATQVVITGSGFTGTQSVKFGTSAAQFTVNADGKLTVTTPVVAAAGIVPLTVTTKAGSATTQYTFT